ncbi:hypothetical protein ACUH96_00725 [Dermabacteraceae bacterium P13077]
MTTPTPKAKKPIHKRWWFIALFVFVMVVGCSSIINGSKEEKKADSSTTQSEVKKADKAQEKKEEKPAEKPAVSPEEDAVKNKAVEVMHMMADENFIGACEASALGGKPVKDTPDLPTVCALSLKSEMAKDGTSSEQLKILGALTPDMLTVKFVSDNEAEVFAIGSEQPLNFVKLSGEWYFKIS